ncbi:AAA family ATPase [Sphingomonas sp.]|uniref:AAA family ATPase n=1 Tax=Sphingomonas sp. TaxID=28214 RepID=UPI003753C72C
MIIGQDRAVAQFTDAMRSGALHHAWLLAGPRGVGKANFARAAAMRLLADAAGPPVDLPGLDTPADHRIAHLLAAGSHPDYRELERLERTTGGLERTTGGLARNISVEQVRSLGDLLGATPFLSPWRAVVIDAADDLEPSGANALLKMLEEPPAKCLFLLVAHNPGRLLPTIRSRCRRLDFQTLDDDAMTSILIRELPGTSMDEIARLVSLAGGSVGRAIAYAGLDLAPLETDALAILREGDPSNARRSKLAQGMSTKASAERYAAFLQLVPSLIAREARQLDGPRQERALDAYARARETAAIAQRLSLDPATTVFQLGSILASVP